MITDKETYPVKEFWNRHVVTKELWDKEEWLLDYLLESVSKSIEMREDFVMTTKATVLKRKIFLPEPFDLHPESLMFWEDFPVEEEKAKHVVLDFITYAAISDKQ